MSVEQGPIFYIKFLATNFKKLLHFILFNTVEFYICRIFSGRTTSPQNYYEDKNLDYKILLATKMLCICAVLCLCEARMFEVSILTPSKSYKKTSIEDKNGYIPVPFLFTMNIEVLSNNKDGDLTFSIPVKLFYLENLPISVQIYHQWNYTFPSLFLQSSSFFTDDRVKLNQRPFFLSHIHSVVTSSRNRKSHIILRFLLINSFVSLHMNFSLVNFIKRQGKTIF